MGATTTAFHFRENGQQGLRHRKDPQTSKVPHTPLNRIRKPLNDSPKHPEIVREGLWGRLVSQVSLVRRRGFGEPRVGDLTDLLLIAALYAPLVSSDAERIEALIDAAITKAYGESKKARAARLSFGADPRTRGKGPGDRHEAAWRELGEEGAFDSWRTDGTREMHEALARQIVTIFSDGEIAVMPPDPVPTKQPDAQIKVATVAALPPVEGPVAESDPQTREQKRGHRLGRFIPATPSRRRAVFGAGVVVMLFWTAAVLIVSLPSGGTRSSPPSTGVELSQIPHRGTIINATTGKVDPHPDLEPLTHGEVRLVGGGPIFRACNQTRDYYCTAREGRFNVSIGDHIKFVFVLQNEGKTPLPYGRFSVNFQTGFSLKPNEARAEFFISWPGGRDEKKHLTTEKGHVLFFSRGEPIYIRYIPGSTELLPLNPHDRLSYLPDGITTLYGIGLTHIGPPPRCFINCVGRFIRFIEFEGEIVG
jgi:hypothetical protein